MCHLTSKSSNILLIQLDQKWVTMIKSKSQFFIPCCNLCYYGTKKSGYLVPIWPPKRHGLCWFWTFFYLQCISIPHSCSYKRLNIKSRNAPKARDWTSQRLHHLNILQGCSPGGTVVWKSVKLYIDYKFYIILISHISAFPAFYVNTLYRWTQWDLYKISGRHFAYHNSTSCFKWQCLNFEYKFNEMRPGGLTVWWVTIGSGNAVVPNR